MIFEDLEFDSAEVGKVLQSILDEKKLVFVGLSSNSGDFSRSIYKEFVKRDFELYPVNPKPVELEDTKVYSSILDIDVDVDAAYIIINPKETLDAIKQCNQIGITKIWLHRGEGRGSVSREALQYCIDNNIEVIPGVCPFMMLEGTMFLHKIHKWFLKRRDQIPILVK